MHVSQEPVTDRTGPDTELDAEQLATARRSLDELLVTSQRLVRWLAHRNYDPDLARRVAMDADDYAQEVMLRALKRFHTFDPARCAFGTWLGGIAQDVGREMYCRVKFEQRDATTGSLDATAVRLDGEETNRLASLPDKNATDPGRGAALVRVLVPVEEMTLGAVSLAWVLDVRAGCRAQVPAADVITFHGRLFAVAVSFDEGDDGLHRVRFGNDVLVWVRAAVTS